MPDIQQPWLISLLPPSEAHKRSALAVSALFLVAFVASVRWTKVVLPQSDIYIPLVATAMFQNDLVTASLLFAQFSVVRSRALLLLATGYLFTALVVAVYGLVWRRASPVLGVGPQTLPWLYLIWHAGLPTSVIVYALLNRTEHTTSPVARDSVLVSILASIACTLLLVCGLTAFFASFQNILPVLVTPLNEASTFSTIGTGAVLFASISASALQRRTRKRSVLDLWLSVVTLAWTLGAIMLLAIDVRYDVAWYATPAFSIVSATLVLLVLLSESLTLYAQLALSALAQRRESEGRRLSMDVMSGAIAHELTQPLAAIATSAVAAVRCLDRTPPEVGEAQNSLKRIAKGADQAADILQSVRATFSNVRHGRGVLPRTPVVDTNELIRESIAMLRGELEAAQIIVRSELAKELTPISVDSGQLQQVLLNLITNAADAMRATTDRARVLMVTSRMVEPNSICVSIEDTGTGIDPIDIDRVLEPFYSTKPNGMGLGLAICRSIVESYGGTVTVGPNAPHGSIFRINVPGSQMPD